MSNTRLLAREMVTNSVDVAIQEKNKNFTEQLINKIESHRLMSHPILSAMDSGTFNAEQMAAFHLEFFHAFAQVFTDAVIETMRSATELDDRLGAKAKAAARFLIQINLLDELGFSTGVDETGNYLGNPEQAHYVQFFNAVNELGASESEIKQYRPSAAAIACRATFENCYGDYSQLITLMSVSETVFHDYASPWAKNVGMTTKIDASQGYHSIHVEDESGESIEDGHSEDAWTLFAQALVPERYEEIDRLVDIWLDVWAEFCDHLSSH
jgi:pyrroloquinoline quinone (PQQ) biosynthesis protein C